jgi:hypothetical protein
MKIKQLSESIWIIDNFLTSTECNNLILFSEQKGYRQP